MICLRPHHILCIQQFKGYGYSEEFVSNMFYILDRLYKEQIIIKEDFDDICKKCPNSKNNVCISDESLAILDNNVLSLLNIELDKPIYFDELKLHLKETLTKENFSKICGSCSWFKKGFCTFENFFK